MGMTIEMLPAQFGDCLVLEYTGKSRKTRRVLIDGGTPESASSLNARLSQDGRTYFDLLVVTHVDSDHIGGMLKLLADGKLPITFDDIWFNGFKHMEPFLASAKPAAVKKPSKKDLEASDVLGPAQGETLAKLIQKAPWNKAFGGGPIVVLDGKPFPTHTLDGLKLTVLSPTPGTLQTMGKVWQAEMKKFKDGLGASDRPGPARPDLPDLLGAPNVARLAANPEPSPDTAPANGSSIVLLAELGKSSCLLGADAWPTVLVETIPRLLKERKKPKLALSALKVPHHGSRRNVTKELLQLLDTNDYLVSTNGARFQHPDPEAIARILALRKGARLHFNYASPFTEPWRASTLQAQHGFTATYPKKEGDRVSLEL